MKDNVIGIDGKKRKGRAGRLTSQPIARKTKGTGKRKRVTHASHGNGGAEGLRQAIKQATITPPQQQEARDTEKANDELHIEAMDELYIAADLDADALEYDYDDKEDYRVALCIQVLSDRQRGVQTMSDDELLFAIGGSYY